MLYHFDEFNFTNNNTIDEIQDRLIYLYNKPHYSDDEDADSEYSEDNGEYDKNKEKYNDYKLGLVKLTDNQAEDVEQEILMENKN